MAMKHCNKLKVGGYLKLAEWWRQQHAGLLAAGRTYTAAATLASQDLKMPIIDAHCSRVAQELEMPLASTRSKAGGSHHDRLAKLEILVEHLYAKLGEEKPHLNGHA